MNDKTNRVVNLPRSTDVNVV